MNDNNEYHYEWVSTVNENDDIIKITEEKMKLLTRHAHVHAHIGKGMASYSVSVSWMNAVLHLLSGLDCPVW